MTTELDPMVDRLWSQMNYAYTVGGGHSGHLSNAAHTARMLSQELRRQRATIEELNDMQLRLRRELATYKEREQTMGWNQRFDGVDQ